MQEARVPLGVAGSVLMVWAAMGVFGAITSAVNHAWGVEKQPSYFKHKMISFIDAGRWRACCCWRRWRSSARSTSSKRQLVRRRRRAASRRCGRFQSFAVKWASTFAFIFVVGLVFYFVPERQGAVPRRLGGRGGDRARRGAARSPASRGTSAI